MFNSMTTLSDAFTEFDFPRAADNTTRNLRPGEFEHIVRNIVTSFVLLLVIFTIFEVWRRFRKTLNARRTRVVEIDMLAHAKETLAEAKENVSALIVSADVDELNNSFAAAVAGLPAEEANRFGGMESEFISDIVEGAAEFAKLNHLIDPETVEDIYARADEFKAVHFRVESGVWNMDDLMTEVEFEVDRRSPEGVRRDMDEAIRNVGILSTSLAAIIAKGYRVDKLVASAKELHEEIGEIPLDNLASEREHVDGLVARTTLLYAKVKSEAGKVDEMDNADGILRSALVHANDVMNNARADNKTLPKYRDSIRRIENEIKDFLLIDGDFGPVTPRYEKFTKFKNRISECVSKIKNEDHRLNSIDRIEFESESAKSDEADKRTYGQSKRLEHRNPVDSFSEGYVFGASSASGNENSDDHVS